jgi:hypothetical protein
MRGIHGIEAETRPRRGVPLPTRSHGPLTTSIVRRRSRSGRIRRGSHSYLSPAIAQTCPRGTRKSPHSVSPGLLLGSPLETLRSRGVAHRRTQYFAWATIRSTHYPVRAARGRPIPLAGGRLRPTVAGSAELVRVSVCHNRSRTGGSPSTPWRTVK